MNEKMLKRHAKRFMSRWRNDKMFTYKAVEDIIFEIFKAHYFEDIEKYKKRSTII